MAGNDKTKLQHWTKRIKHWETSGLTQRAYCERESLKYSTFDYWRRQIGAAGPAINPVAKAKNPKRLTLVPLRLLNQSRSESMRLHSPGGWQLELPGAVEAVWLATLLRQLS